MKKWFINIFLIFLFIPLVLSATSPSELEQQIEQVRIEREVLIEEQKKLQAELEATNKESQTLGSAVKSLDTTRKKLAKDISITQSKITSTNLTIKSLENTMSEKEKQIIVHREAIALTIATLSDYDSRPLILNLLASSQISDIWKDRNQLEGLNTRLSEEIDALRETRIALSQQKEQKIRVKEEQTSLKGQLSGQKSVVEESQKAKERLLAETKNKEAEYQKMLALNLARQKQFEEDLYNLESALKITLDPSLIPSPRHSIFSWPLENVFITQRFGKTSSSNRLYASGIHKGVDFRATQGTPIMAMLGGVVERTDNTDKERGCYSFGRWILIRHSNGLASIYAHLSVSIVQNGQSVKTGEIIGYSGGTPGVSGSGYSTGPHLHVGVYASQGVEIQQFVTSKNCKNTFVPIADLKAYLDPLAYLPTL